MQKIFFDIIITIFVICIIVFNYAFFLKYILEYTIGKMEIEIRWSYIYKILSVKYEDIVAINEMYLKTYIKQHYRQLMHTYWLTNRIIDKVVVIEFISRNRHSYIVITPDDPERFILIVKAKVEKAIT